MFIRPATLNDIPALHEVRMSVNENKLNNPALVTEKHYIYYLQTAGKGWLYEIDGKVVGFAIVSVPETNVWALFLHPDYEGKGIGRSLQAEMLNWYFSETEQPVWLSTAPESRAATFYRKTGWRETGLMDNGELGFEMSKEDWENRT
ncbi:GNAT family N-acetyltransferase [uncultured Chitinophaga sp.]|uniref:GNAT family N-acetyltransferase n=1 Tax=uncultured Chitinophaga sp. TaxID=339340 RepID=UPI00260111AD|nr:GNAT family N-acetyltransferase [uncultured Chitinophaga sp.]